MSCGSDDNIADLRNYHAPQHLQREEEEPAVVRRRSSLKLSGSLRSSIKLSVNFSTIEFRSYEVILGDSPSCRSGAPISLGWRYDPSSTKRMSMLDYDRLMKAAGMRPPAKRCEELVLSERTREAMLLEAGYAEHELIDAARRLRRANRWRTMRTYRNVYLGKAEDLAVNCGKKLRKTASLGKSGEKEQNKRRENDWRSRVLEEQRLSPGTGISSLNHSSIGSRDVELRQVCMQAKCA